MDYSSANLPLWNIIIQLGIITAAILVATFLRRKIGFFRKSLMPTAVLAGFLLLILRNIGILRMDIEILEILTYHGIAIGFIAMALRVPSPKAKAESGAMIGAKSGALIVSSYAIQAVVGILVCVALAFTLCPGLFKAAGVLLPMGYGQGTGQANNVGATYESLGFVGGRSFGLAIAASGYLVACVVGVIALNVLAKQGKVKRIDHDEISGSATVDTFQSHGEVPISESLDRLSMQVALILVAYLATYLITLGITSGIAALSPGLAATVNSVLWGFNFIIGSLVGMLIRTLLSKLKKHKIVNRQYQNNYLLNRIGGLAFDIMIVSGIASINFEELSGLWLPFILMSVAGTVVTWLHLSYMCKHIYKDYYYQGLLSMYGMMTGTISSGILLLREIDPEYDTPAANNLVLGSSFGIAFGAPILVLVGMAPKSDTMLYIVLGICAVYYLLLSFFIIHKKKNK